MASLSQRVRGSSKTWEIRLRIGDRQKTIGLGSVSKRNAEGVLRHVQELLVASKLGNRPETATVEWLKTLAADSKLRNRLVELGLTHAGVVVKIDEEHRKLKPFLDATIAGMNGNSRTISNYQQTANWLLKYFADDTALTSLTPSDMERWGNFLKSKKLAYSNRRKLVQRARKFFELAVEARLLDVSPAGKLRLETKPRHVRKKHFVDAETSTKILKGLEDDNWRLVFALLRYGGFRRCEVDAIRWEHVDFNRMALDIHSPKTGFRNCPIFPELLPYLEAVRAAEGRLVRWSGDVDSLTPLLRKRIISIIGKERMWPQTCIMLRSTRRTELEDNFAGHVLDDWLGHSSSVADEHYLQVTDEHWSRAIAPHNDSRNIPARTQAYRDTLRDPETQKPLQNRGFRELNGVEKYPRKDSNLGPAD